MMDILEALHSRKVSLEEAQDIFDKAIDNVHSEELPPEWWRTLGLSEYEATAYLHGATLADLSELRYEGWPTVCSRCGRSIDYRLYGWLFVHSDDGIPRLRHLECPNNSPHESGIDS